ncbi:hypothetical protein COLO4_27785 [Corchorus olitorius]|uniref:Uncharacterized protein n=1 Tax=Corchorus olitorius TaxID=93759 RepID=A0A1R3HPA3_9ROSI|nr:hypothetical protein COLO4_27785 [Corchorus olitorius]
MGASIASNNPHPLATMKFWGSVGLVMVTLLWVWRVELTTVLNDIDMVSKSSLYNPFSASKPESE